jgi:transposase
MEVIMQVQSHHTAEQLRQMARMEPSGRVAVRMIAVAAAMENKTAPVVAKIAGAARRSVQDWVRRYNQGGVEKLRDEGGRGRKPPLTPDEQQRLKARLNAGALEKDGVCVLRGLDVQRILKDEFNKVRSLSSVYELLHSMGYNDLMPRPQHRDADPAAQEAFKKSP